MKLTSYNIKKAERNGISRKQLEARLRRGWAISRAVSQPIGKHRGRRKTKGYADIIALAKQNNIPLRTFRARIDRGWTFEEAATVPVQSAGSFYKPAEEWAKIAVQNGINPYTYHSRVYIQGWDKERAATQPTQKKRSD